MEAVEYDIVTRSYTIGVFGPPHHPVRFREGARDGHLVGVGRTTSRFVACWFAERDTFQVKPDPISRDLDLPVPIGFPERERLARAGLKTLASVHAATNEDLLAIPGIGVARVRLVRRELSRLITPARRPRRSRRLDPHEAVKALVDAVEAYASAGVPVFLQDGVLLGAVREGRPLAHDKDVDLGVMHDLWRPEADDAMREAGFENIGNYNEPEHHYHQKFQRAGIRFCVFHYYRAADGRIFHGIRHKTHTFVYPREFEIREYPLMGELVPAPHPPEEWLEIKYGANWRTPVTVWDCRRGPANAHSVKK